MSRLDHTLKPEATEGNRSVTGALREQWSGRDK